MRANKTSVRTVPTGFRVRFCFQSSWFLHEETYLDRRTAEIVKQCTHDIINAGSSLTQSVQDQGLLVHSQSIKQAEFLGIAQKLRDVTGWDLDYNSAMLREVRMSEEAINAQLELAIRKRLDRVVTEAQVKYYMQLSQISSHMLFDYPPIPTATTLAQPEIPGVPDGSGIYFVFDPLGQTLLYVGQSVSLKARVKLSHTHISEGLRVAWVELPLPMLNFAECYYIGIGRPPLNFGQTQVMRLAREIETTSKQESDQNHSTKIATS